MGVMIPLEGGIMISNDTLNAAMDLYLNDLREKNWYEKHLHDDPELAKREHEEYRQRSGFYKRWPTAKKILDFVGYPPKPDPDDTVSFRFTAPPFTDEIIAKFDKVDVIREEKFLSKEEEPKMKKDTDIL